MPYAGYEAKSDLNSPRRKQVSVWADRDSVMAAGNRCARRGRTALYTSCEADLNGAEDC